MLLKYCKRKKRKLKRRKNKNYLLRWKILKKWRERLSERESD
jgi:hypothetical protein